MGDRAQVHMKKSGVWLYAHWGARRLEGDVRNALSRRERWNDEEYLARIIFDEMIGDQQGTETGFGISTSQHGDVFKWIEIDCANQKVIVVDTIFPIPGKEHVEETEYSFEEFILL